MTVFGFIILAAFGFTYVLDVPYLFASLFFFGAPCLWLSHMMHSNVRSALRFALLFGVPLTLVLDYFAIVNKAWTISTVFPFLIGGVVPVEDACLGLMLSYEVAMLSSLLSGNLIGGLDCKKLYLSTAVLLAVFGVLVAIPDSVLQAPYAYLWIGIIIIIIPLVTVGLRRRVLHATLFRLSLIGFIPLLLFEIIGLRRGYWAFPSEDYLGWVSLLSVEFPVEELVFWMILAFPAVRCLLEMFRLNQVRT